jgi:hypothetical protein
MIVTRKQAVLSGLLFLALAAVGRADLIVQVTPSVDEYITGQAVDFDVSLAGTGTLASYAVNIGVRDAVTDSADGLTLIDLDPDDGSNIVAQAAPADYVFGNQDWLISNTQPTGVAFGLHASDAGAGTINVQAPMSLFTFRLQTAADFEGVIEVSIARASVVPDWTGWDEVPIATPDPVQVNLLPEPATLTALAVGAASLIRRRRRR